MKCTWIAMVVVTVLRTAGASGPVANTLADALGRSGANRAQLQQTLDQLDERQRHAGVFLIEHMPDRDLTTLSAEFLLEHIRLAFRARSATPWGRTIPDELFLNYVLPYANVNERRDAWRRDMFDRFMPVVADVPSASHAALKLNKAVFEMTGVRYHPTKRPKPDQSPSETLEAGYASCTGLSILLIDACRAVGIPARFVGTPSWTSETGNTHPGNHSWVEVWDGAWYFLGASEVSALDRTWFFANASKPEMNGPGHRIFAASFRKTPTPFPLVWDRSIQYVKAVDVTPFYTARRTVRFAIDDIGQQADGSVHLTIRSRSSSGTSEIVAAGTWAPDWSIPLGAGQEYEAVILAGGTASSPVAFRVAQSRAGLIKLRRP
jgi:hypothetical protein